MHDIAGEFVIIENTRTNGTGYLGISEFFKRYGFLDPSRHHSHSSRDLQKV